jgi:peptidyl-prolyl cis-trans isomerase D
LPAWIELAVGNAGHVVVKISKVVARENNSTAPPRKEEMAQITRWMAAAESVAYYNDLKEKLKVKIMVPEPKP